LNDAFLSFAKKQNRRSGKYQNLSKVRENLKATGFDNSSMSTKGQRLRCVKTCLLPAKTHKICRKKQKFFCPLLDISVSGSPIIQDGKLVGAVTHVLVNDPTRGYGIFIENMLGAAG
jgi:hypothetical protein